MGLRCKAFLLGLLPLFFISLAACTSDFAQSEKQQMVEHVSTAAETEFDLIHFNKSYKQYHKIMNEIVDEEYWKALEDEIVFGYEDMTYTRNDLANISQEQYDEHKKHMLDLMHSIGMDRLSVNLHISDVYNGDQSNQAYIYTIENQELKEDEPLKTITKKYRMEKQSKEWLITDVLQDEFTYGSDQTAEAIEKNIEELKYQTHDGKSVGYPTVLVLSGLGEE